MMTPKPIPQLVTPTKLALGKGENKKTIPTPKLGNPPPAIMPQAGLPAIAPQVELPIAEPNLDETVAEAVTVDVVETQPEIKKPEPAKLGGGILTQFDKVRETCNAAVATVNGVVDRIGELQTIVIGLQSTDHVSPDALEAVSVNVAAMEQALAALNGLPEGLAAVQTEVTAMQERLAGVESLKESLAAHSQVEGRVTELATEVAGVRESTQTVEGRLNEVVGSFNELVSTVNSLNENVAVIIKNLWGDE